MHTLPCCICGVDASGTHFCFFLAMISTSECSLHKLRSFCFELPSTTCLFCWRLAPRIDGTTTHYHTHCSYKSYHHVIARVELATEMFPNQRLIDLHISAASLFCAYYIHRAAVLIVLLDITPTWYSRRSWRQTNNRIFICDIHSRYHTLRFKLRSRAHFFLLLGSHKTKYKERGASQLIFFCSQIIGSLSLQ